MSDDRKDLPPVTSPNFLEKVREAVQTYLGNRGATLDRGITLRDLTESGLVTLRSNFGKGSSNPIGGPGSLILDGVVYEPDLTPPPVPSGFAATAAISNLLVECDPQTYTQGHGHAKSRLYGATWTGGALPVFTDAVVITEFSGTVASHATNPATTWHLWLTWVTVDGVESTSPAGGTNGVVTRTGEDVALLLEVLTGEITESQLYADLGARIDLIDVGPDAMVAKVADLELVYGDTVSSAESAANAAQAAADAAQAEANAVLAQGSAEVASTNAALSASDAATAKASAILAQGGAANAATAASTKATEAATSATNAAGSAAAASSSSSTAATAATNAGASATSASLSASNAATSASDAETSSTASNAAMVAAESARSAAAGSASAAATSASTATTKASDAATSASAANTSATTAATKAGEASTSASNAVTSATNASGSATSASTSAGTATASKNAATTSATNAATSATNAAGSATNAAGSASAASTSATTAAESATAAGGSATAAGTSATNAATSATNSANSATASNTAKVAAESAKTAALGSATAAATSASTAATKASEASTSASTATTQANTATTKAGQAATSATSAATSETNALGSKNAAATSASTAAGSATTAGGSAAAAGTSATNAATSATNAGTSSTAANTAKVAAETARDAASGSATAAATSASTASTKATNADTSATAAAASATTASTKAGDASTYASQAATSASNAAGSATTASTQAGIATTAKTNAGASAAAALVSQSAAATSATNAAGSASSASSTLTNINAVVAGAASAAVQTEAEARISDDNKLFAQYTVKTDVGGLVSGYGLASTAGTATPSSAFGIQASKFFVAPPAVASATAPTTGLYKGYTWRDTSTNTTKYYTGSAWNTTPQTLPFVVQATATTINGESVPAGVYMDAAYIKNGTITNAKIANLAVDDAKIDNLSVAKLTAGELQVGGYIQSPDYTSGASGVGYKIGRDAVELPSTSIRGQLTAEQIDSRGLSIWNAAGTQVILSSGSTLSAQVNAQRPYASGAGMVIDGFRTTNPLPQEYVIGEVLYFKQDTAIGLSGTLMGYGVLRTNRPYGATTDLSGGSINQWFEADARVWARRSTSATTWSAWQAVPNGTITAANASTYIADLAVDTLQIAGNAVTLSVVAKLASEINITLREPDYNPTMNLETFRVMTLTNSHVLCSVTVNNYTKPLYVTAFVSARLLSGTYPREANFGIFINNVYYGSTVFEGTDRSRAYAVDFLVDSTTTNTTVVTLRMNMRASNSAQIVAIPFNGNASPSPGCGLIVIGYKK